jgi:hypothetical protein
MLCEKSPTLAYNTCQKQAGAPVHMHLAKRSTIPVVLIILLACLGISFTPARTQETENTFIYWDMGLKITYPTVWGAPLFTSGELLLAPPDAVSQATPNNPAEGNTVLLRYAVTFRLVDPTLEYNLLKDAPFREIAAAASTDGSKQPAILDQGAGSVGPLPGEYVMFTDTERKLQSMAIAFMLPDGRFALMIGIATQEAWPDFAIDFEKVRSSISLIRPMDYAAPTFISNQRAPFAAGSLSYPLPDGWTTEAITNAVNVHYPASAPAYRDDSGFVNGPQLVLRAIPMPAGKNLRQAMLEALSADAEVTTDVPVGNTTGIVISFTDDKSGQEVRFIGFTSQNGRTLNLLRWTVPTALKEVVQPALEVILKGMIIN